MNSSLYLRRRRLVLVPQAPGSLPLAQLATLYQELEPLGFTLSPALDAQLRQLDAQAFADFYRRLLSDVRKMLGAHHPWRPLYPGFPQQVMQANQAELYLNAIFHYASSGQWLPAQGHNGQEPGRKALAQAERRAWLKPIDLGSQQDFETIFTQLAGAKSSLSAQDAQDLAWFVQQYGHRVYALMPPAFHSRENLALLGAALLKAHSARAQEFLAPLLQTATDVLRLAVALGGGDVSLATPSRFGRLARPLRRWLLSILEGCGQLEEDMWRRPEVFKRLGEVLHPGEYGQRFARTLQAFAGVRNGLRPMSFSSLVEQQLRTGAMADALQTLAQRPGELARRLDHLLRCSSAPEAVLAGFAKVANQVSTAVLLQAMVHFHQRDAVQLRSFFPKGSVAKVFAIADERPSIHAEVTQQAAELCEQALLARFAALPPLGRCHVEAELANYLVPFSQRSAAKALHTLVRGSRMPLPRSDFIRLFLWWKNGRSRTDIDLSAALYGPDFNYLDVLSYYNLKGFGGCHSGDVVDAPQGAAEFIDLDVQKLKAAGARFVVASINSYTTQPFCDLPECFAGWMARSDADSGEIFEPATVQDRVDIASNTSICLPMVFDLQQEQVIWADIALERHPRWNNNVAGNLAGVSLMLRSLTSLVKPDLHTLFMLHARARGQVVAQADAADTVFGVHQGITPFALDRIRAEFL